MKKKKIFKVKKIFSSLLISYVAILVIPFVIVFVLVGLLEASSEKYSREVVNNCLTKGRMEFEKRLEAFQTVAFTLVYDNELSQACYIEKLVPGDKRITTLINCNEKLNETFADSSIYYDYCVLLENEFVFRKKGMSVGLEFFYVTLGFCRI